jgi:hypothetical protein
MGNEEGAHSAEKQDLKKIIFIISFCKNRLLKGTYSERPKSRRPKSGII